LAELVAKGVDVHAIASHARHVGVPMEYLYMLMGALAHKREDRCPSVKTMLAHVRRIQDGQVAIKCHVTLFKRLAFESIHWVDRHPGAYSLILMAVVLALIGCTTFEIYELVAR
jgi:hypothetical protein